MTGENEWIKSTNDQVARLTNLINSLVALSRLEEQPDIVLQDVDFSYITEDAADDFKGTCRPRWQILRYGYHSRYPCKIQRKKSLFELVTLLVDNANKYCDPEGTVTVRLRQIGRTRKRDRLEVLNTYKDGKAVDYGKFLSAFIVLKSLIITKSTMVLALASPWRKAWSNCLRVESLPPIKMTPSPLRSSCKHIF